MDIKNLVYVGTYTEAILFGTGQVLQGQGKGIYSFVFDPEAGTLTPHIVTENVRNPSYLCFNRDRTFLYCVNEYKEYEGKPSGGVSAFRIDQKTGGLTYLNSKPSARHRPVPPDHRSVGPLRVDRKLRLGLDHGPADPAGRLARRRDRVGAARGLLGQSGTPEGAARPRRRVLGGRPLRLRPRSRQGRGDRLRLRCGRPASSAMPTCPR